MKRGFLLRAQARKAAANLRASSKPAAEPLQPHRKSEGDLTSSTVEAIWWISGFNVDPDNLDLAERLAYGNLSDEQKGSI